MSLSRTGKLVYCAAALALAFLTGYIRLFTLPFGGSVTLCSMLFIVLTGYWFGPKYGLACGILFSLLQFLQDPVILNPLQFCCDYLFAFTSLGISGFFRNRKHGLISGYIAAILVHGFWNSLGGYLFWMDYMPESFPQAISVLYPIIYNYGFICTEGALTLILLALPPVREAINRIGRR